MRSHVQARPGTSSISLALLASLVRQVATVHDVIVRPGYRRQGVGRRILQLLCRYLDTNMDVIDVGTTCWREETKEFLGKAGFGDDDEQSVAMRLVVRNGDELHRFGNGK